MATPERGPLAGGTLARPEARAAQRRPPPRTDRRQALSVDGVQGEGRLDVGARIFARGAHVRRYRTRQVALDIVSARFTSRAERTKDSTPLARAVLPARPAARWPRVPVADALPSAALRQAPRSRKYPPRRIRTGTRPPCRYLRHLQSRPRAPRRSRARAWRQGW